jgi:hypothetical protein
MGIRAKAKTCDHFMSEAAVDMKTSRGAELPIDATLR